MYLSHTSPAIQNMVGLGGLANQAVYTAYKVIEMNSKDVPTRDLETAIKAQEEALRVAFFAATNLAAALESLLDRE